MNRIKDRVVIVEAPPPSLSDKYVLVYSFTETAKGLVRTNKKTKETITLKELLSAPGVKLILGSLIGGTIIIIYVLYQLYLVFS